MLEMLTSLYIDMQWTSWRMSNTKLEVFIFWNVLFHFWFS